MKLLIDGAVFSQKQDQQAIDFWQQLIPRLILRLRGDHIYYLNRNPDLDFPEITTFHNLYTPLVDYSLSALEDRRLASLCRDLEIDVFISTYNTSAGSGIKTLFVDTEHGLDFDYSDDFPIISSKQRSLRFTSCYLTIYQEKINNLQNYVNLPSENIRIIYTDSHHELDWIAVANFVAKTAINLTRYQISQEIAHIQLAEEEATQSEALQLRKQVYGEEAYKNYYQSTSYKIEQKIKDDLAELAGLQSLQKLENIKLKNAVSDNLIDYSNQLPIHFFTIVLNGQPFIQYHINIFKKLPFKWHWHIVEGVADLKHDTAWALQNGGTIVDEFHNYGLSTDGTSEYIDQIGQLYPENITIYRKPKGVFWDGKKEMVNAPLKNLKEECLLWQIDVDELWTFEQLGRVRKIFLQQSDKTAAFYWCWYFVGENLIISTRNCYAENPQQDWLRTWRFIPGDFWFTHEPPILARKIADDKIHNVGNINPFLHDETEKNGLVFQHFAYVLESQLHFKELYYGYKNAIDQWQNLQKNETFPALLRNYFAWVGDNTLVSPAKTEGIIPIFQRDHETNNWSFISTSEEYETAKRELFLLSVKPIIIIDGVFFQLYKTGIARVWQSLLEQWANTEFANHILVLDRANTVPKINGIRYRTISAYNYNNTEADKQILQDICYEESAELFISTYYTTPIETPSVFMAYDMIPEVLGGDLNEPMWREKHNSIQHASSYISISEHTAKDLHKCFPDIPLESITVAHCGVAPLFSPASEKEINTFKHKYGINKPYFLLGNLQGYKNSILFFQALSQLVNKQSFDIISTGIGNQLPSEWRQYIPGCTFYGLQLTDEELRLAYAGALALVYPSKYEGFGMPVIEAMGCGCPVITTRNASLPEVAGAAAIYINDNDVMGLADALCEVQKPSIRNSLINAGLAQAKKFSWKKMAETVSNALVNATQLSLNLRDINLIIFPDWLLPEDELGLELQEVIQTLANHPENEKITLIVHTGNIAIEDAEMFLSSVAMNLLMEDLDISDTIDISLVGKLGDMQWQSLLPRIYGRIVLDHEDKVVLAQAPVSKLKSVSVTKFSPSPKS